jgi:type I restriction enzyme R subunit
MAYSEEDIRAKFIDPAIQKAGWSESQIRREVSFTEGRIIVRGKTISRGERKRVDYILYYKKNIPIALIEAKDDSNGVGHGMQQALSYAESLDVPFVYSSNGSGFLEHNRLNDGSAVEQEIGIDSFPSPEELIGRYLKSKNYSEDQKDIVLESYYDDGSGRSPRYYQQNAVNKVIEAVAKGKNRILLVMATGTGKTYTSFQIIYRLWKSRTKKRILFLVDRTALAQQTMQGDFRHFGEAMTKVEGRNVDPSYEIYVALYQGLMGADGAEIFKQFSPDFFDLIVVDECHRGSANENGKWRAILDYFGSATHVGLTATPKEDKDVSNSEYFGEPIYTYSLKQGIEDGFLAPYKVIRYVLDKDIEWRPDNSIFDEDGNPVPDEVYTSADYDGRVVIHSRTKVVAEKIAEFLKETDVYQKTIVFCRDIDHAERMRKELVNALPEQSRENRKYIMRITGDNEEGKLEIENFINPEQRYPTIATTSRLLSTGVDTKTVKLVVLDAPINSMTEFKQIIGRGTRVEEQFNKYYFTIMDFRGATRLFADPDFDGEAVEVYERNNLEDPDIAKQIEAETVSESEIKEINPREEILIDGTEMAEKPKRIRIRDGVEFYPIHRTVQFIDPETGKLTTESLRDFSKKAVLSSYKDLDAFLARWREAERKDIIINELSERGVVFDELREEAGKDLDVFDLILHVAYDKKPLTRSERINNLRQNDYFSKYQGAAREIIDRLIEKYSEEGITAIDGIEDLQVSPFTEYGTPVEIVNEIFGGREAYLKVVKEIESALYAV